MIYQVANIVRDVRICMDENATDIPLVNEGDENVLQLDEIISSKIVEGVQKVHQEAPYHMLDNGHHFNNPINWKPMESGEILLPDDFMRLVVFQMSDWERPVYVALTPDDPEYAKCRCRVKALRGTAQRPVCALGMRSDGKVLEFYSCKSENATVSRAVYVPYSSIDPNGGIDISSPCYTAAMYAIAGFSLIACGETERGASFLELAKQNLHRV